MGGNGCTTRSFTVATDAVWEVEDVYRSTFEVITPSASYWVVKSLGQIVSVVDAGPGEGRPWIDFSSGYRPNRAIPSFTSFDLQEEMTTVIDEASQTPTHLQLLANSENWRLIYDFYPTHVTLTVNAAFNPYGIAYRGVVAGLLEETDQFVLTDSRLAFAGADISSGGQRTMPEPTSLFALETISTVRAVAPRVASRCEHLPAGCDSSGWLGFGGVGSEIRLDAPG